MLLRCKDSTKKRKSTNLTTHAFLFSISINFF